MATKTVSLEQAESHLSELIRAAEQGEDIVIAEGDRPRVKLVPIVQSPKKKRVFGQHRGKIHMSEDFDAPLPDDFWFGRHL